MAAATFLLLALLACVAPDGAGNVYVADSYNHRVQKFKVGP